MHKQYLRRNKATLYLFTKRCALATSTSCCVAISGQSSHDIWTMPTTLGRAKVETLPQVAEYWIVEPTQLT